jgi:retron-type reverse transcriptase
MRRAKDLFPRVVDFTNLSRAYTAAARRKRHRGEVRQFEHCLEPQLWSIHRDLEAGTYRWGAYRRFLIRDPKLREIRAAPFRDRVVHQAIFHVLDPIVRRRFIDDTYACLSGRGPLAAVRRFREFAQARQARGWMLKVDVKSYFASVDHAVLRDRLARATADRRLLDLLGDLLRHGAEQPGKGMPIGNLTSQLFANLYLDPLDHFVKEQLGVRHYLRYMDDAVCLLDDQASARGCMEAIEIFLDQRLRLRLNPLRTLIAPLTAPADVLGYVHRAGQGTRVRRRSVQRLWHRLPRLAEREQRGELTSTQIRASLASWIGLAKHADAFRLSRMLFFTRDVRNRGKRLLVGSLGRPRSESDRSSSPTI